MKTKSSLGELEMPNGDLTSDRQEKADILNNFFVSVFENEGNENLPETKSKGVDNIHPMLIKYAKKGLDTSPENHLYKIPGRRKSMGHMESGPYLRDI